MRRLILILLLIGCATPYQARGWRGGYKEEALPDGTYVITVNVNGFTGSSTAFTYFQRRAVELCVSKGFTTFDVLSDNGVGEKVVTGRIRCVR